MKTILVFLASLLISGCFFVVKDNEDVKIYGSSKETALNTLKKLDEVNAEEKKEIKLFQKKVEPEAVSKPLPMK